MLSAASEVLRSTPAKFNGVTVESGDLLACDDKAEMSRRLAASVGGLHSGLPVALRHWTIAFCAASAC